VLYESFGEEKPIIAKAKKVLAELPKPIVFDGVRDQPEEKEAEPVVVGEIPKIFDPDSPTWHFVKDVLDQEIIRLRELNDLSTNGVVATADIRGQIKGMKRLADMPRLLKEGRFYAPIRPAARKAGER
jgi:hypothetical protein